MAFQPIPKGDNVSYNFPGDVADELPRGDVVLLSGLQLDDRGVGARLEFLVVVEALLGLPVEGLQVGDGRRLGRVVWKMSNWVPQSPTWLSLRTS